MSIISQLSRANRQSTIRDQSHTLSPSPAVEIRDMFAKLFGEPVFVQRSAATSTAATATQRVLRMK